MKTITTLLILCSFFIMSSQNDDEIKGIIVNQQNIPVKNATISIPSAFLRTVSSEDGKFNLSLANMIYKTDDVIEISIEDTDEIIKLTIDDYLKLNKKVFVMSGGEKKVAKNKKAIATIKQEPTKYTEAKKTSLILDNVKKGNKISIKNYKGKVFFKELIETSNLKKKEFDLNYLVDGSYFFEIEKDLQISIIPFNISYEKGVIYSKYNKTRFFKPHIKVENEVVILTQISENGDPITINIYDENNQLLYNDTTENELDIQRAFKLKKGSFKFVITSNNREYATLINNYD
ncbi:hypothetical protein [Algibacter sp. R77976]|uniref:hypothetical protein n=1 Tax=Algibacter sp. R77976 TaxID=3093873 RepID=UPI0037CB2083